MTPFPDTYMGWPVDLKRGRWETYYTNTKPWFHDYYYPFRHSTTIAAKWALTNGDKAVDDLITETKQEALRLAAESGITKPMVTEMYDNHFVCGFVERPMSWCGPGHPAPMTWKEVFARDYRDNPLCQYIVIIRDEDREAAADRDREANP